MVNLSRRLGRKDPGQLWFFLQQCLASGHQRPNPKATWRRSREKLAVSITEAHKEHRYRANDTGGGAEAEDRPNDDLDLVYRRFTEGFETPNLTIAREFLEDLA